MDKSLLNELSEREKRLFKKEYSFIKKNLPLRKRFSSKINNIIVTGLIKLVKNNSGYYINNIYLDFVDEIKVMTKKPTEYDRYEYGFNFKSIESQYIVLLKFMNYYEDIIKKGKVPCEFECVNNEYGNGLHFSVRNLHNCCNQYKIKMKEISEEKKYHQLYNSIIEYLLVHFMVNNNTFHEDVLYGNICQYLLDNYYYLLDYYKMNYCLASNAMFKSQVNNYIMVINDLIDRYNKNEEIDCDNNKKIQ